MEVDASEVVGVDHRVLHKALLWEIGSLEFIGTLTITFSDVEGLYINITSIHGSGAYAPAQKPASGLPGLHC